jgi:GntR family transcriptional regulator
MPQSFFSPYPKYLQIRAVLLRRLQDEFAPGDRFPTEAALCEEFGVSRETIREALAAFEEQGLIVRGRGTGAIVRRRPEAVIERRVTGLVEDFAELNRDTYAKLITAEVRSAQEREARALSVAPGSPIYFIRRLRILDGAPLVVHDAYLPVEYGVPLARRDLSRTSIQRELRSCLGEIPIEDFQEIDAGIVDPQFADLLSVPISGPLLQMRRRHIDSAGKPVVFFVSWFRSDRYYATVKFPRPSIDAEDVGEYRDMHGRSADMPPETAVVSVSEWLLQTHGLHIEPDRMRAAAQTAVQNLNTLAAVAHKSPVTATPADYESILSSLGGRRMGK